MRRPPEPQLLGFLERFDATVAELVLALRAVVLQQAPDAMEAIYDSSTVSIWFGFGGSKEWFCYVTAHSQHVNLGFPYGAELADPQGQLQGEGKTNRHIQFLSLRDLERPFVRRFLQAAITQVGAAIPGPGISVIKPTQRSKGGSKQKREARRPPL